MQVQALDLYPFILLHDFLRYFITAALSYLIFWVVWKKFWQERIIQNKIPSNAQKWREFGYSMITVIIFSMVGFNIVLMERAGWTMIYNNIEDYSWMYAIGSFFLILFLHDAYFYFTHRIMHHPLLFKHVHLVHHLSNNPSPWAAYAFHPFEAVIQAIFYVILVLCIPVHPVILFSFVVYMIIRNVQGHLGIEFLPAWFIHNPWFNWLTTTTHHDLHHKYGKDNYGLYFTWWDDLFKTTHPEYKETFDRITKPTNKHLILLLPILLPLGINGQNIEGQWISMNEKTNLPAALIEIRKEGSSLSGNILKIYEQPWEGENPICYACKEPFKNKKVKEIDFLWGFSLKGNNGRILDPQSGKIYYANMHLSSMNLLIVQGSIDPFQLIGKKQEWVRIQTHNPKIPLTGVWESRDDQNQHKKAWISIQEENGILKGRIIKVFPAPPQKCTVCKEPQRNQPIEGLKILWGFKSSKKGWTNGEILDPNNGKVYNASIELKTPNQLKVKGYWGPFSRSQTWQRKQAILK